MSPAPSRFLLLPAVLTLAFASACGGSDRHASSATDPMYEDSPGNPGSETTVNEYTAPELGGSHSVAGDPPAGNPAVRPSTTTVTSATVHRRAAVTNTTSTTTTGVAPSSIGSTGGAGTVSEGAGGSSGTDTATP